MPNQGVTAPLTAPYLHPRTNPSGASPGLPVNKNGRDHLHVRYTEQGGAKQLCCFTFREILPEFTAVRLVVAQLVELGELYLHRLRLATPGPHLQQPRRAGSHPVDGCTPPLLRVPRCARGRRSA